MPLVEEGIANLINGVSQQEDKLRLPTQCEDQVNCRNDPVKGMGKRPNTTLIAELEALDSRDNYQFHTIIRDDLEQYLVAVGNGEIRVYDWKTGVRYPVEYDPAVDPANYFQMFAKDWPQNIYQILTLGDSTFICNTTKAVLPEVE